jgi:hypothetical protein
MHLCVFFSLSSSLCSHGLQVHQLILDATNPLNLCEMYIGWAPFL